MEDGADLNVLGGAVRFGLTLDVAVDQELALVAWKQCYRYFRSNYSMTRIGEISPKCSVTSC